MGITYLVVFALSLHHLRPELAARVFAEGTRAANKLFIIDLRRPQAPLHLLVLAAVLPFTGLVPVIHDGFISSLRACAGVKAPNGRYAVGLRPSLDSDAYFDAPSRSGSSKTSKNKRSRGLDRPRSFRNDLQFCHGALLARGIFGDFKRGFCIQGGREPPTPFFLCVDCSFELVCRAHECRSHDNFWIEC